MSIFTGDGRLNIFLPAKHGLPKIKLRRGQARYILNLFDSRKYCYSITGITARVLAEHLDTIGVDFTVRKCKEGGYILEC